MSLDISDDKQFDKQFDYDSNPFKIDQTLIDLDLVVTLITNDNKKIYVEINSIKCNYTIKALKFNKTKTINVGYSYDVVIGYLLEKELTIPQMYELIKMYNEWSDDPNNLTNDNKYISIVRLFASKANPKEYLKTPFNTVWKEIIKNLPVKDILEYIVTEYKEEKDICLFTISTAQSKIAECDFKTLKIMYENKWYNTINMIYSDVGDKAVEPTEHIPYEMYVKCPSLGVYIPKMSQIDLVKSIASCDINDINTSFVCLIFKNIKMNNLKVINDKLGDKLIVMSRNTFVYKDAIELISKNRIKCTDQVLIENVDLKNAEKLSDNIRIKIIKAQLLSKDIKDCKENKDVKDVKDAKDAKDRNPRFERFDTIFKMYNDSHLLFQAINLIKANDLKGIVDIVPYAIQNNNMRWDTFCSVLNYEKKSNPNLKMTDEIKEKVNRWNITKTVIKDLSVIFTANEVMDYILETDSIIISEEDMCSVCNENSVCTDKNCENFQSQCNSCDNGKCIACNTKLRCWVCDS